MSTASLTHRPCNRRPASGKLSGLCEALEPRQLLTADLTASIASVAPTAINGRREQVGLTVSNIGTTRVNATVAIQIYAIPQGTAFSPGSAQLLTTVQRNLHMSAGGTQAVAISVPISASTPTGNYQLVAVVDSRNRVAELDETNNTAISPPIAVTQGNVDLTSSMTLLHIPLLVAGRTGTGVARVTVTNTALSTDTTPLNTSTTFQIAARPARAVDASSDVILATGNIPAGNLSPGASRTVTVPIHFPSTLTPGDIKLIVDEDTGNALAESNELNNQGILPVTLTVGASGITTLPTPVTGTINPVTGTVSPGTVNPVIGTVNPVTGGSTTLPVIGTPASIVMLTPTALTTTGSLNLQPVDQSSALVSSGFPVTSTTTNNSGSGLFPSNLNLFPSLSTPLTLGMSTTSPSLLTPNI